MHVPHMQAEDANGLQKALADKVGNFQIVEGEAGPGRLENLVELAPFLKVRAGAACRAAGKTRTDVNIDDARVELFGLRCARMPVLPVLHRSLSMAWTPCMLQEVTVGMPILSTALAALCPAGCRCR